MDPGLSSVHSLHPSFRIPSENLGSDVSSNKGNVQTTPTLKLESCCETAVNGPRQSFLRKTFPLAEEKPAYRQAGVRSRISDGIQEIRAESSARGRISLWLRANPAQSGIHAFAG